MNNKQKKGISLIVLVITIIVMIILASAIIISLSNNGIINKASTAVLKTNLTSMQDMASIYLANNYKDIDMSKEYLITEFGITDKAFEEYIDIAIVKAGKVYIKPTAPENVQEAAKELNMLIDGKASNIGNITLDKTGTALKIYGSAQGVGDKTKNLLSPKTMTPVTENGITLTLNSDGSFTVNGTATANAWFYNIAISDDLEVGKTYKISCPMDGSSSTTYQMYIPETSVSDSIYNISSGTNLTVKEAGKIEAGFVVYSGVTVDNLILKPQLEEGSKVTEYEPYGYKIPVTMTGKNLAKLKSVSYTQSTLIEQTDKIIRLKGNEGLSVYAHSAGQVEFKINTLHGKDKQVTVSFYATRYDDGKWKESSSRVCQLILGTEAKYSLKDIVFIDYSKYPIGERNLFKYTLTPAFDIEQLSFRLNNMEWKIELDTIQIEYGDEATEREAYNAETYNIYLKEPLRKVDGVVDYIDCTTGAVVRYVGVNSATGALEVLSTSKREKITVPTLDFTNKKYIFVDTLVTPSNIEVKY